MTPCTRCENGWLMHPDRTWGVACEMCQPGRNYGLFWLSDGDVNGRVVHRSNLPPGHASQHIVPMPDWVRPIALEFRSRLAAHAVSPAYSEDS